MKDKQAEFKPYLGLKRRILIITAPDTLRELQNVNGTTLYQSKDTGSYFPAVSTLGTDKPRTSERFWRSTVLPLSPFMINVRFVKPNTLLSISLTFICLKTEQSDYNKAFCNIHSHPPETGQTPIYLRNPRKSHMKLVLIIKQLI